MIICSGMIICSVGLRSIGPWSEPVCSWTVRFKKMKFFLIKLYEHLIKNSLGHIGYVITNIIVEKRMDRTKKKLTVQDRIILVCGLHFAKNGFKISY